MMNMKQTVIFALILLTLALLSASGHPQVSNAKTLRLDSLTGLEILDAKAEIATYRGRRSVHLSPVSVQADMKAIIQNVDFKDGTIELEVAGAPLPSADEGARGFIGVVFRV